MSVFRGLKKIAEAAVDIVLVVPDALVDGVKQEWHEPGIESRTRKRLRRALRRTVQGGAEIYQNRESDDPLRDDEAFRRFLN